MRRTRDSIADIWGYYTLGIIGKAGLGTPHMDGNTRLYTATSAAALKLSFGTDGQPGSYSDLDTTEAILHVGHNIACTELSHQTEKQSRWLLTRVKQAAPQILAVSE